MFRARHRTLRIAASFGQDVSSASTAEPSTPPAPAIDAKLAQRVAGHTWLQPAIRSVRWAAVPAAEKLTCIKDIGRNLDRLFDDDVTYAQQQPRASGVLSSVMGGGDSITERFRKRREKERAKRRKKLDKIKDRAMSRQSLVEVLADKLEEYDEDDVDEELRAKEEEAREAQQQLEREQEEASSKPACYDSTEFQDPDLEIGKKWGDKPWIPSDGHEVFLSRHGKDRLKKKTDEEKKEGDSKKVAVGKEGEMPKLDIALSCSTSAVTATATALAVWVRAFVEMQDCVTRRKKMYGVSKRQGKALRIATYQTRPVEQFSDWLASGYCLVGDDVGGQFLTDTGKQTVTIYVPAPATQRFVTGTELGDTEAQPTELLIAATDYDWRQTIVAAMASVMTQLFIHGNSVRLVTEDDDVRQVAAVAFQHLLRYYQCLTIESLSDFHRNNRSRVRLLKDTASQDEQPTPKPYLEYQALQNTWILLHAPRMPSQRKSLARYLVENNASLVLANNSPSQKANMDKLKDEIDKVWRSSCAGEVTHGYSCSWTFVDNLEGTWAERATTHCISIFASQMQMRQYTFQSQLHGGDDISVGPSLIKEWAEKQQSKKRSARRREGPAQMEKRTNERIESVHSKPKSVIGINTNAIDTLLYYPQLPFLPGKIGNSFLLRDVQRVVLKRPYEDPGRFSAIGCGFGPTKRGPVLRIGTATPAKAESIDSAIMSVNAKRWGGNLEGAATLRRTASCDLKIGTGDDSTSVRRFDVDWNESSLVLQQERLTDFLADGRLWMLIPYMTSRLFGF